MAAKGAFKVNLYGAVVTGAADLRVHLFRGNMVYNSSSQSWVALPVILSNDNNLDFIDIPFTAFILGVSVDVDVKMGATDGQLVGVFDLVYADGTTYLGGMRINIKSDGTVDVLPE